MNHFEIKRKDTNRYLFKYHNILFENYDTDALAKKTIPAEIYALRSTHFNELFKAYLQHMKTIIYSLRSIGIPRKYWKIKDYDYILLRNSEYFNKYIQPEIDGKWFI